MLLKNLSPLGAVYVPALDLVVAAGEVVDTSAGRSDADGTLLGVSLAEQPSNWVQVDDAGNPIAPASPAATSDEATAAPEVVAQ